MSKKKGISRRKFIGQAGCLAMGSTTLMSTILNLGMINTVSARPHIISNNSDYKAMVCILLSGGNDSFNMLVPTEDSEYAIYKASRENLALNKGVDPAELLDLDYSDQGRTFAVHGKMPQTRDLFNDGTLSFLCNVGTLIEPIKNKSEYSSGLKKLPLGLYSHSDQVTQWQTSVPQSRFDVGVAGRMADLLQDMNQIPEISLNISFSGNNRFQLGNNTNGLSIYRRATDKNVAFKDFSSWLWHTGYISDLKENTIKGIVDQTYNNIFQKTYADLASQSIESGKILSDAFARISPLQTQFSDHYLSESLKKVIEMISIRKHTGSNRQIFFINYGGWDHHEGLIEKQNNMLPVLDNALAEFNAGLEEIGMKDQVVTFTTSDFSRTLTTNGLGSDHAWGGNQIIMGGPINGGKLFGEYPSLLIEDNEINVSARGRLIPKVSVDEYYAELALWFGASPNDLDYILPNLCNFYSAGNCPAPLPPNYMPIGMFK